VCLDAYAHNALPFEKMVEALRPERSATTQPLFQVMFAFQNAPGRMTSLGDVTCEPVEVRPGPAKFDLSLYLEDRGPQIAGLIEFDKALFNADTISRMREHYLRLVEQVVENPDCRIGDLSLMGPAEQEQVLFTCNGTTAAPGERCLHELFEAQVVRTPDAVALRHGLTSLTYNQLNRRANQVAHDLRDAGVGAEVLVGLCMDRSVEMVTALLGILKSGGAYVPLDPAYPLERLRHMVRDCGAAVLVTESKHATQARVAAPRTIALDTEHERIAARPWTNPDAWVTRQNVAYVIYTSGSTGSPKGVAIEHRSAVAFLDWARGAFSASDMRAVLASTSICFDLSIFELFAPLCLGGSVVLCQTALDLPTEAAAPYVTLINTVPSAMSEVLRAGPLPASARIVNLAGEPLQRDLVAALYAQPGVDKVVNLYGPSEDTTYSTCGCVSRDRTGPVSIGRPISITQSYVVDPSLRPVPIGITGELLLGGHGVARGYVNQPCQTADKFIPDPFSGAKGARLYRTGDLVRWLARGELEFLGRFDQQVKLRGYRIELGEIEEALARHALVRQVVAAVSETRPGDRRLVAYVAFDGEEKPSAREMKAFLRPRLPEYMIPSFFVYLDSLPMTPNGKVDRRALPPPDSAGLQSEREFDPPRTSLEKLLSRIWVEILHVDRVGRNDDFFELGGHSLLAVQVVARVNEALRIDLPLRTVFERRTLPDLAASAEQIIRDLIVERIERSRTMPAEPAARGDAGVDVATTWRSA
jgi:amino acid adenylation domain-containing protein